MNEPITHRLSAEGADPLTLVGVNDANLVALERVTGVRATLRGDHFTLAGDIDAVERATKIASAMIDVARMDQALTPDDVERLAANGDQVLGTWTEGAESLRIVLPGVRRPVQPKTPGQSDFVRAMRESDIMVGIGPAGTGKTYLAVAMAVSLLMAGEVNRIILSRPAVEAGERLGFLPGDLREKVDPYLRPLYDALYDMLPADQVMKRLGSGEIEVAPLAFMRGRTLGHSFIILDEAQNTTPVQMKMCLTRLGEKSRMVVTGDTSQVDLPAGARSGLADAPTMATERGRSRASRLAVGFSMAIRGECSGGSRWGQSWP